MYYANSEQLSEQVLYLVKNADPPLECFCIDASAVDDVDFSAAETLRSLHSLLDAQGVRLVFAEVMDDVRSEYREQLKSLVEEGAIYPTLEDVVSAYRQDAKTS